MNYDSCRKLGQLGKGDELSKEVDRGTYGVWVQKENENVGKDSGELIKEGKRI